MTGMRELLIEKRPCKKFNLYCAECEEEIYSESKATGSDFKDEVLIRYTLWQHGVETGHWSVHGNIEPVASLEYIDATITVNNNV